MQNRNITQGNRFFLYLYILIKDLYKITLLNDVGKNCI